MSIDFTKIKLVIWDLDETFWKGILSENTAQFDEANAQLIRDLTDAGVVNAICSKNDEKQVVDYLSDHGIDDLFVFNSINWSAKGTRVKQIIQEMNLRAPNVLFIDDNPTNLGEAKDVCPELMISDENILPEMRAYYQSLSKKDKQHKRLNQYRVLEKKKQFRASVESNDEFLWKCNIQVQIKHDCEAHIERIEELVQRSNQLNFTKVRSSLQELREIIADPEVETGYVESRDKFGDYGIIGFFALKSGRLLHFVFSCRTLNMGIEQYVYSILGRPAVEVVGEVSSSLDMPVPDWINCSSNEEEERKHSLTGNKVLFKGPCDLQQVFSFIKDSKNIITEFTYVNNRGIQIEQGNHTVHIVESVQLSDERKKHLIKTLPFGDSGMFRTKMFDPDIRGVVLSMFNDPNMGLYQEKNSGAIVAFGEYTNDLTDESKWRDLIDGSLFTANCRFHESELRAIKENYSFLGRIQPEASIKNLDYIYNRIDKSTKLILCLGSELPYLGNTQPAYEDRHLYHRELNRLIREWARDKENVALLDVNLYVKTQDDFTNNINHFQKRVYYLLSEQLIRILDEDSEQVLQLASETDKIKKEVFRKIKKIPNKVMRLLHGSD